MAAEMDTVPAHSRERVAFFDGWRGLSIALVLAGHFLPGQEHLAGLGVQLFFALSGRLMAHILFVEKPPLRVFYRRRLARIYPGLAAFVLLAGVLLLRTDLRIDPASLLAALGFGLNYWLAAGHMAPAIENLWSLCIEEHAYVLLGFLAFIVRVRRVSPAVPLFLVAGLSIVDGLTSRLVFHQDGPAVFWRTDAQLAPIFLAAGVYLVLQARTAPGWLSPLALLVAALASFAPVEVSYVLTPAALAIAICTLEKGPPSLRRVLSGRPLVNLGLASYSIYLWQHPFYRLALAETLPWWAALPMACVTGILAFNLVEQPSRRWLYRVWASGADPVQAGRDGGARPVPSVSPG